MSDQLKLLFAALMGGLVACVVLSGLYLWKAPKPLRVAKVDIQSLLKQEARHLSEQKLSAHQEETALAQVMMRLRSVFAKQDPHTILLDHTTVLSPQVPDMTAKIRQQLNSGEQR